MARFAGHFLVPFRRGDVEGVVGAALQASTRLPPWPGCAGPECRQGLFTNGFQPNHSETSAPGRCAKLYRCRLATARGHRCFLNACDRYGCFPNRTGQIRMGAGSCFPGTRLAASQRGTARSARRAEDGAVKVALDVFRQRSVYTRSPRLRTRHPPWRGTSKTFRDVYGYMESMAARAWTWRPRPGGRGCDRGNGRLRICACSAFAQRAPGACLERAGDRQAQGKIECSGRLW